MHYTMIGKSDNMTPAGEFIADASLGKTISEHLFYKLMACYPPDGMVFVDDDGVFRMTYRGDLVPAPGGLRIKTIPGTGVDVTQRELADEMQYIRQMAMELKRGPTPKEEQPAEPPSRFDLTREYLVKLRDYKPSRY